MTFEMSKENINGILMAPEIKILKIGKHMKKKSDCYNPRISFKEKHQKIYCNGVIGM